MKPFFTIRRLGSDIEFFLEKGQIKATKDGRPQVITGLTAWIKGKSEEDLRSYLEKSKISITGQLVEVSFDRLLGGWPDTVHSGIDDQNHPDTTPFAGTYEWAQAFGFEENEANIIAGNCSNIDNAPTDPCDIRDPQAQSWHFNINDVKQKIDSRILHAVQQLQKAKDLQKQGRNEEALAELGRGLHAVQDSFSHVDDLVTRYKVTGPLLRLIFPEYFYGHANELGDLADVPVYNQEHENGGYVRSPITEETQFNERYSMALTATFLYFFAFKLSVNDQEVNLREISNIIRERLNKMKTYKSIKILMGFWAQFLSQNVIDANEGLVNDISQIFYQVEIKQTVMREEEVKNIFELLTKVAIPAFEYKSRHPDFKNNLFLLFDHIFHIDEIIKNVPEKKLHTEDISTNKDRIIYLELSTNEHNHFTVSWSISGTDAQPMGNNDFIGIYTNPNGEGHPVGRIDIDGSRCGYQKEIHSTAAHNQDYYAVYFTHNPQANTFVRLKSSKLEPPKQTQSLDQLQQHKRNAIERVIDYILSQPEGLERKILEFLLPYTLNHADFSQTEKLINVFGHRNKLEFKNYLLQKMGEGEIKLERCIPFFRYFKDDDLGNALHFACQRFQIEVDKLKTVEECTQFSDNVMPKIKSSLTELIKYEARGCPSFFPKNDEKMKMDLLKINSALTDMEEILKRKARELLNSENRAPAEIPTL